MNSSSKALGPLYRCHKGFIFSGPCLVADFFSAGFVMACLRGLSLSVGGYRGALLAMGPALMSEFPDDSPGFWIVIIL